MKTIRVEKKQNDIINRLNKTKVEKFPDLLAEREERDRQERNTAKEVQRKIREQERLDREKKDEEAQIR